MIYHLHVGMISRKTGRSSVASSAYRSGEKLHNDYDGMTHDYSNRSSISAAAYRSGEQLDEHDFTNKRGVVYSEIMLPENAPAEYQDRTTLWNAVEQSEKRKDAQTARDIDVALPVELERHEQIELMQEYIQQNFVDKGMIADFAIHDKEDGNPHAHIMLTTRDVDEDGFKNKNREWNKKSELQAWRENWAVICNEKMQAKGLDERIDHRTLEAQGIDREPTIHIGIGKNIHNSDRVRENNEIIARNEAKNPKITAEYMCDLKDGYLILDKEITATQKENAIVQQDMNILRREAEEISERAENIQNMRKRIDEMREQRQKMGVFENKKNIDEQIKRLEASHEQARNYFTQTHKFSPEQAEIKAQELENKAKSKGHFQERLNEKLTPLIEEREAFKIEYQKQKLLSGVKTEEPRNQAERTLEMITEQNFQDILRNIEQEQAKELIRQYERERERERVKAIVRSR